MEQPHSYPLERIAMDRRTFLSTLALAPLAAVATRHLGLSHPLESMLRELPKYSGSMWIYLWDLVDEGQESVFQKLRDNKITGISLASAYHTGKFLEPHNPKEKVVFLEDGTIYFRHNPKLYGRLKPKQNSLIGAGHSLQTVKRAAERAALQTRAWVVCCHNTRLGMLYPDIVCEDCFGDKIYHNLCPSNEDVRKYLRALVSDVASIGVDTIELEALQFQGYTHGYHHEREGIELNSASRFLLGLCFCPACVKRASQSKCDIRSAQQFTKQTLESWFADPSRAASQYPGFDILPEDVFGSMNVWRQSVVSSLVDELMDAAKGTKLRQLVSMEPSARKLAGVDVVRSAKSTGGILALGYVKDGAELRKPLEELQKSIGEAQITLGLQVGLPESGGKKEFLGKVLTAREFGINSFNYYNYGFIPLQNLSWIKEAVAD